MQITAATIFYDGVIEKCQASFNGEKLRDFICAFVYGENMDLSKFYACLSLDEIEAFLNDSYMTDDSRYRLLISYADFIE